MIQVIVAYATPKSQVEIPLEVEENCSVVLAIKRSGILQQWPEITFPDISVGLHSRRVPLDAALEDGDRIEIYRSLQIDPKQARLLRAERAKARREKKV
jgi:putative ubiquitin-RnfH superfamily antitoxin RatB of RatAB toxin-antitoxin module